MKVEFVIQKAILKTPLFFSVKSLVTLHSTMSVVTSKASRDYVSRHLQYSSWNFMHYLHVPYYLNTKDWKFQQLCLHQEDQSVNSTDIASGYRQQIISDSINLQILSIKRFSFSTMEQVWHQVRCYVSLFVQPSVD